MRNVLKWTMGLVLALLPLVLPGCSFNVSGLPPVPPNFNRGDMPLSSTIFCDVQSKAEPNRCATDTDKAMGIPLSQSAVALVQHRSSNIGLDYSPTATAALSCAPGQPVAIVFKCPFPDGCAECLNCGGVIGPIYADANAACVARCLDINDAGNPPLTDVSTFCQSSARTSANAPGCFAGACTDAGALRPEFEDPRRVPEPVVWRDPVNVVVSANSLTKTAATGTTTAPVFDAGAASTQTITKGDGYVEFSGNGAALSRACGLALGAATDATPDADPTVADIRSAIRLAAFVRILENGTEIPGPEANGSWGPYDPADRFRVTVTDNHDGTATIGYVRIPASCSGSACDAVPFHTAGPVPYPFRVDASLGEPGAALSNVVLVRIQ